MKQAELALTKAWQNQSPALKLLSPLSALYGAVSQVRKSMYANGVLSVYHAPVPVLIIGNITVGGSGKTPLIIALVEYLLTQGVKVGVISRGYGGDSSQMPCLVQADSTPTQVGDEPCLIVQSIHQKGLSVPMAVGANRQAVIELLLSAYPDIHLIISDDGLQHYALHRDAEWIVVDGQRGFGNGKLMPQGFLREPISRLDGASVIYHDKDTAKYAPDTPLMHLAPTALVPLVPTAEHPPKAGDTVYAVSGIGYPKRFFDTLTQLGYQLIEKPFGDHHAFSIDELQALSDLPIIITAKDAVKIRELQRASTDAVFERIWVLPVEAKLSDSVYQMVDTLIDELHLI